MKIPMILALLLGVARNADATNNPTAKAHKRILFEDDDFFWSRLVPELVSNSVTPLPSPSPAPTPAPTSVPTPPRSPAPTSTPSTGYPRAYLSDIPNTVPTATPAPCIVEIEILCPNCNRTVPPLDRCEGRPFEMGFIYNGGDCGGSFNIQAVGDIFFCTDSNGGPPTTRGEASYIVVTSSNDLGITYHSEWVQAGEYFKLYDGGNFFEDDQTISIWSSNDTRDPNNLLQRMTYHSSCSQNLFLKDRFGAVQLVEWVNEVQGRVSCFAKIAFSIHVSIPVELQGDTLTLETLTVASNIDPFYYDFTDKISGTTGTPGEVYVADDLTIKLDLTQRRNYNLLFTLTAITDEAAACIGDALLQFDAGTPLPPIFPTLSSTQAPSGSPSPNMDPARSPCILETNIQCVTASGRSCSKLSSPTQSLCNDKNGVRSLELLVTGQSCGNTKNCYDIAPITESSVYVEIVEKDTNHFAGVVPLGGIFRVSGPFEGYSLDKITLYSVSNGGPGSELQVLETVELGCDGTVGEDLMLLNNYGGLQLVGFDTSQGSQSVFETLMLTMTVTNSGSVVATVQEGTGASPFEPNPIILNPSGPAHLEVGAVLEAETSVLLNLAEFHGDQFEFRLDASGIGFSSGMVCSSLTAYTISVS
jgi:hypothetical protein